MKIEHVHPKKKKDPFRVKDLKFGDVFQVRGELLDAAREGNNSFADVYFMTEDDEYISLNHKSSGVYYTEQYEKDEEVVIYDAVLKLTKGRAKMARATAVGNTVYNGLGTRKRDPFSLFGVRFNQYVADKYEGLFPDNMPTREEMRELNEVRKLPGEAGDHAERLWKKKNRIVAGVAKEWLRQQ